MAFEKKHRKAHWIGSQQGRLPWRFLFLGLLGATLLASCATVEKKKILDSLDQILIGTTKMNEVRSILGNPNNEFDVATLGVKRMHFGDGKTATIWLYVYSDSMVQGVDEKYIKVEFDNNGTVSDYSYSSNLSGKKTNTAGEPDKKDFDIFLAREKIVPGKTAQEEVLSMLGKPYRVMPIHKPGIKERWAYVYKEQAGDEKALPGRGAGNGDGRKPYTKQLYIDFNETGVAAEIKGGSDFPADKDKFFTK